MRVYIAAPWTHRTTAHSAAKRTREAGHTVTSHWHDDWLDSDSMEPLVLEKEALTDLLDIEQAQRVIVLNITKSEGKAFEQGYAMALKIPIIVVGDVRLNVFQYLKEVTLVRTLEDALDCLVVDSVVSSCLNVSGPAR